MGGCGASKMSKPKNTLKFSVDPHQNPSKYTIKIVTSSLLFNLVGKDLNRDLSSQPRECEYIDFRRQVENHAEIKNSISVDITNYLNNKNAVGKSLKILLDFKNCVFLGEDLVSYENFISDNLLDLFKELEQVNNVKLQAIYIGGFSLSDFFNDYPFLDNHKADAIKNMYLPLLLFDIDDQVALGNVIEPRPLISSKKDRFRIFLQGMTRFEGSFNLDFYRDSLGVSNIIFTYESNFESFFSKINVSMQQVQPNVFNSKEKGLNAYVQDHTDVKKFDSLLARMIKMKKSFILVHDKGSVEPIINRLMGNLSAMDHYHPQDIGKYIGERIPKLNTVFTVQEIESKIMDNKAIKRSNTNKEKEEIKTRLEEIKAIFVNLKKETKSKEVIDEFYNMISVIIDNIIKNPEEEKVRSLNSSNAKLKQKIFKYKAGTAMLEHMGFVKDGSETTYRYALDDISMKLIKADFDVAYRTFEEEKN